MTIGVDTEMAARSQRKGHAFIGPGNNIARLQYLAVEPIFTTAGSIHDCLVTLGKRRFLICCHYDDAAPVNRALKKLFPGFDWRGELVLAVLGQPRVLQFVDGTRVKRGDVNRALNLFLAQALAKINEDEDIPASMGTERAQVSEGFSVRVHAVGGYGRRREWGREEEAYNAIWSQDPRRHRKDEKNKKRRGIPWTHPKAPTTNRRPSYDLGQSRALPLSSKRIRLLGPAGYSSFFLTIRQIPPAETMESVREDELKKKRIHTSLASRGVGGSSTVHRDTGVLGTAAASSAGARLGKVGEGWPRKRVSNEHS
ncbi:hypothetical protein FB45DRAFT_859237 [Roridomyces roridus]|uniref:Uncharacterized protein n=1 Tax=Roridomyces roridus TaxID=1738132 RepID=A0AAD7CJE3_9AGAR|nr:hypothetical protein FB45DRAFT_859237 [Roridomyces roridus]